MIENGEREFIRRRSRSDIVIVMIHGSREVEGNALASEPIVSLAQSGVGLGRELKLRIQNLGLQR